MEGNRGYSGGVELAVARAFTDPKKRVVFGLSAGLTLSGINTSQSGQVNSTLHVYTDYYSTHGATLDQLVSTDADKLLSPGTTYHGPSGMAAGTDGNIKETTVAISATPDVTTDDTNIIDGAKIDGKWKIKGAYFTLKVGPQMVAKLTHSIGLSASIGLAGSYVGTTYTAIESFNVAGVPQTLQLINPETTTKNMFLPGYYANADATWALNERAGFFAGLSYENLGEYSQRNGVRTSKIDLSATAGVRGGLSIKF